MRSNTFLLKFVKASAELPTCLLFLIFLNEEALVFRLTEYFGFALEIRTNYMWRELERIIELICRRDFKLQILEYINPMIIAVFINRAHLVIFPLFTPASGQSPRPECQ